MVSVTFSGSFFFRPLPFAWRPLKRRADGTVQDIDDRQVFKVKKTKTGVRLVPKFGRMDWKGAQGFASHRSCKSRY